MPSGKIRRRVREPATEHVLHVELQGIRPPIWRGVVVPSRLALSDLHQVIQCAMPWTNSHLYQFCDGASRWTDPALDEDDDEADDAHDVATQEVLPGVGSHVRYVYDF